MLRKTGEKRAEKVTPSFYKDNVAPATGNFDDAYKSARSLQSLYRDDLAGLKRISEDASRRGK